jgi:hypothetical protein
MIGIFSPIYEDGKEILVAFDPIVADLKSSLNLLVTSTLGRDNLRLEDNLREEERFENYYCYCWL